MVFSHQSKTTTRPQTCRTWCERHHRNAQVQHLSCRCLVVVLLRCENTISLCIHTWQVVIVLKCISSL